MDYQLAHSLKDAGFPQHGRDVMTPHTEDIAAGRESVYYPPLEELIDAVRGYKGNTLSLKWEVYDTPNEDGPWSAHYYGLTPVGFYERGEKTLTEAVAHLWLTINKKQKDI